MTIVVNSLFVKYIYNYQHFTTFTPPRKLTKRVYTRPELSPLFFLQFWALATKVPKNISRCIYQLIWLRSSCGLAFWYFAKCSSRYGSISRLLYDQPGQQELRWPCRCRKILIKETKQTTNNRIFEV